MNLMEGLVNGIIAGANFVEKRSIPADNVIGWFKEKLGIHSPSVVFTELGNSSMEGLANGVANNQQQPLDRITSLTERMTQIAGGMALATTLPAFGMSPLPSANLAPIQFDRRPPVSAMVIKQWLRLRRAALYRSSSTQHLAWTRKPLPMPLLLNWISANVRKRCASDRQCMTTTTFKGQQS
jgi:hypothetical protein